MSTLPTPTLSVHRAFVVQFTAQTNRAAGCWTGRVEHIVSGQATRFTSLDELLAFFERVLIRVQDERPEGA